MVAKHGVRLAQPVDQPGERRAGAHRLGHGQRGGGREDGSASHPKSLARAGSNW